MRIFQHHVLAVVPRAAQAVAGGLLAAATPLAEAAGGRVFGVFTPMIGLSNNHIVMLSEFADEAAARGVDLLKGQPVGVERHEFWEPDPRPEAGAAFPERDGFFSHRWFDCAEADWPKLRELSVTAWDNFEGVHDTRVVGFWRSRTPPGVGLTRVWLMAWYKGLYAWESSRYMLNPTGTAAEQAFANFRARRELTVDSAVSILRRTS
jgi:hypothetical protein